jgi:hypothetical protein
VGRSPLTGELSLSSPGRASGPLGLLPGAESAQQWLEEPVRGHQGVRHRIGVRPGRLQAWPGPQDSVVHADEVLAVGAAPGRVDQAAIGLVGQDAAPPVRCVELAAFAAAGSKDKTLRVFTIEEGGSEHVNADDPDPARQLIADWFAQRLGTLPIPSA